MVVTDDAMFFEEIVGDGADAEFLKFGQIDEDGLSALAAIAAGDGRRDGLAVGDNEIDDATGSMFLDGANVVGEGVAGGFARLGHEIGDIDARGLGFSDGGGDFRD